ncbi:MAG: manganese efflux pump MntP family protein [Coriobacteriaceae bacterium]
MGFIELFLTGVGLSMDAFAVAICKGLGMRKIRWRDALVIALFFGGFQALMPLIGWAAGSLFASTITAVDHWIAFGLLAFIGGKMLWAPTRGLRCAGAVRDVPTPRGADCDDPEAARRRDRPALDYRELVMLAIATSIDALAVGITFAFLGVNIWVAITIIGVTTFVLSLVGVVVGNQFGSRFEKPATIAGGIVLILIGLKILIEHLAG